MNKFTLADLEKRVHERAKASAAESYTRALIEKGVAHCAKKLGEEAIETGLAAAVHLPVDDTRNDPAPTCVDALGGRRAGAGAHAHHLAARDGHVPIQDRADAIRDDVALDHEVDCLHRLTFRVEWENAV